MRTLRALLVTALLALPLATATPAHAANFDHCYDGTETGFGAFPYNTTSWLTGFKIRVDEFGDHCDGVDAGVLYVIRQGGHNVMALERPAAELLRGPVGTVGTLRHAANQANLHVGTNSVEIEPVGWTTTVMTADDAYDLADALDAACGTTC